MSTLRMLEMRSMLPSAYRYRCLQQCWTIQDSAGTEQNSAGQYCTGQCRKEQKSAGQYRTVLSAGKSRTVLDNTGKCRKEQNSAGQYRTVQERAVECWKIQDSAEVEQNSAGQYRTVQGLAGQFMTVNDNA